MEPRDRFVARAACRPMSFPSNTRVWREPVAGSGVCTRRSLRRVRQSGTVCNPRAPPAPSRPDGAPHAASQPKPGAPDRLTGPRVAECLGACTGFVRPVRRNRAYLGLANTSYQVLLAILSFCSPADGCHKPLPAAFPRHSILERTVPRPRLRPRARETSKIPVSARWPSRAGGIGSGRAGISQPASSAGLGREHKLGERLDERGAVVQAGRRLEVPDAQRQRLFAGLDVDFRERLEVVGHKRDRHH